jgi:hypothetical protein
MLEQPDNSSTPVGQHHQEGVDIDASTFLHFRHTLLSQNSDLKTALTASHF